MGTGVVRRIDELGRIVIPKELRRTMHIHVGDEMEIRRTGDVLEIKKYSRFDDNMNVVSAVAKMLAEMTDAKVLVFDLQTVIIDVGGDKKRYTGKAVSGELEKAIQSRKSSVLHGDDLKEVINSGSVDCTYLVFEPIESCGDSFGGMALLLKSLPSDVARAYLGFCTKLVGASLV